MARAKALFFASREWRQMRGHRGRCRRSRLRVIARLEQPFNCSVQGFATTGSERCARNSSKGKTGENLKSTNIVVLPAAKANCSLSVMAPLPTSTTAACLQSTTATMQQ